MTAETYLRDSKVSFEKTERVATLWRRKTISFGTVCSPDVYFIAESVSDVQYSLYKALLAIVFDVLKA